MKLVSKLTLINLFCLTTFTATADDISNQYNQQMNTNMQTLTKYLQYLGGYLGYDLTVSPTANNQTINQQLLSISTTQLAQSYVYSTFFGAFPVAALSSAIQIVPTTTPGANMINKLANTTFTYQGYSSASSSQQGKVSASSLIDQVGSNSQYQQDPVSQAVLNILGTPDYTYCMSTDQRDWNPSCNYLYENLVTSNVIGALPDSKEYFTSTYNQQLIGQLNVNSLMGTMQYSTENTNQNNTGSPTPNSQTPGLTAQNQAQQALNFIRYASGSVVPVPLPTFSAYNDLYNIAVPPDGSNVTVIQQKQAQATLNNYLANLRVYAAQSSVGIGNLYYLLSKRLPQNQSGSNNALLTSQAMSEFNMASWRLFNPDMSQNKQWITQLNNASPATVEKEIATLLAEMNYQMYLDRQIQERILLTNSIMLIQNTRSGQPSANFGNQESAPTTNQ
ncbi:type IVB secretion system protein IcmX [Legionella fallonii]|uniref:Component of the Dot/Icm secretion system n=1 Tax=Legionella fallonii LLAP-10 TaxID=1212491 RepID=A0A098G1I9_9GAMM|nr:type IVB secretion system protein IcmX [Legionella fallonii]CEG55844.1 Component of the Dot/Icm secretion system [Legionella fallonii LLAP-10]